ncbi:hypothetical protein [Micromonospora sp. RTP1Z1]|uniref:hypothetical protein n=1 Tax=Micromonospora sp. RTP1Z1 TaxID=2994043 RepID=UPI0029C75F90|nr:hypothetical protein [Micromonospora sp. RTP1Z1]
MGDQPAGAVEHRALPRRASVTTHGPVLPIWTCGGCGAPWPCAPRKRELRAEFAQAPVSLALYMGAYLVWAAEDLVWVPAGGLYQRFVGWVR